MPASHNTNYSALFVDDEPSNRLIGVRLLEKLGYRVDSANDGAEAFLLANEKTYDIIIMDCMMPGVDGYTTTEYIRASGQNTKTPIIAFTANATDIDRKKCLDAGMSDFLAKPLKMKLMRDALDRWLGKPHPGGVKATSPHAEDTGNPEEAIDLQTLRDMFGEDDNAIFELLHEFRATVVSSLKRIEDAYGRSETLDELLMNSHRLKGTSSNFGAFSLAKAAAKLEEACQRGDRDRVNAAQPEIEYEGKRLIHLLDQILR